MKISKGPIRFATLSASLRITTSRPDKEFTKCNRDVVRNAINDYLYNRNKQ